MTFDTISEGKRQMWSLPVLVYAAGHLGSDGHHVRHPEVDAISLASLTARK